MHPDVVSDEPGTCPMRDEAHPRGASRASTWTCPMHPEVVSDDAGHLPAAG